MAHPIARAFEMREMKHNHSAVPVGRRDIGRGTFDASGLRIVAARVRLVRSSAALLGWRPSHVIAAVTRATPTVGVPRLE
jgi:hypothetical protein